MLTDKINVWTKQVSVWLIIIHKLYTPWCYELNQDIVNSKYESITLYAHIVLIIEMMKIRSTAIHFPTKLVKNRSNK